MRMAFRIISMGLPLHYRHAAIKDILGSLYMLLPVIVGPLAILPHYQSQRALVPLITLAALFD